MSHPSPARDALVGPTPVGRSGPVVPSPGGLTLLTPLDLDAVALDPAGLAGSWQARNAEATLPHCIERLELSGAVANLRHAATRRAAIQDGGEAAGRTGGGAPGDLPAGDSAYRPGGEGAGFTGMWFSDSDVYKTLEAVAWQLARADADPALQSTMDTLTALLVAAQDDDGYLNSYFTVVRPDLRWRELSWSHELYCAGHLIQAAVAATRTGVGARLLPIAVRFADLIVDRFGPGGEDAVCGHPEIETALVELYRETGHRPYLATAARFIDLRGTGLLGEHRFGRRYYQDHEPVRAASEVTGHAVRQLYLLAAAVDVAVETRDESLLAAAERLWDDAFGTRTYLTGGHGSRHRDEAFGDRYELPPDRAYAETCAAVASFQWNWRLLLATGRSRYADEMERTLFNAIAGATAADGRHFYYSNPLQLRTGHDGSDEDGPAQRLPWYSCACCPPNLARLMASLHTYVATTTADGLQLHLPAAGSLRATVAGREVDVEVCTNYPWDGRIRLDVSAGSGPPWTLAVRVPAWCRDVAVEVDGHAQPTAIERGYLRLTRAWTGTTSVLVDLAMPPRLIAAHPRVDAVRGCVALARGPLVYCVEQADLPAGVQLEDVLLAETGTPDAGPSGAGPSGAVDADPALAGAVRLSAAAAVAAPDPALYHDQPPGGGGPTAAPAGFRLLAVPYFLRSNRGPAAMRVWLPVAPDVAVPDGEPAGR